MGLIAQRFEESRNRADFLKDDDELTQGRMTSAGVRVDRQTALSLTTVWRCVDLLSSAVGQAPKDIVVKVGGRSFPEFSNLPGWLTLPNPTDPTYTINDYFSQVAISLLFDGNYFVATVPDIFNPQALIVLDPNRVDVRPGPLYDIKDSSGHVIRTVGPYEMLHGTWIKPPGALRGVAPLEALRRGIGSAVAAEDFGGRFFGQGAALSFGVQVDGALTPEQKAELAASLRKKYAGNSNSHAIGILTGGAKFVSGLAPTPEQAQMLATRKFSVEDLCRPYGVPPSMAGSQEPGASSYASADIWRDEFRDYAVLPLAVRIEAQHNRLVSVPLGIDAPGASAAFKFNLDHVARTSLLMRYQAHKEGVTGGFITPNEARNHEDLPPMPDQEPKNAGDRLYMQRQMVSIDQLGTTAPIPGAAVDAALAGIPPVPIAGGTP